MTHFADLQSYVEIPRVLSLRLSPAGDRLVSVVQTLGPDRKKYVTALWEIDPAGERPPRRLTRSAEGEAAADFAADGSVLFVSRRPDSAGEGAGGESAEDVAALWLLPAGGGEARRVAAPPGGITGVVTARNEPALVYTANATERQDTIAARKDAGVSAVLHEAFPVRYWDHDLGPGEPRLYATALPEDPEAELAEPRDLTPDPVRSAGERACVLVPDGSRLISDWEVPLPRGERRRDLVAIDVKSGERHVLASEEGHDFSPLAVCPAGRRLAYVRERHGTPETPVAAELWVMDLVTGDTWRRGGDLWPEAAAIGPDALYFAADHEGRRPVFRVGDGASGPGHVRLTPDDAAYSELCVSPDGRYVYALRGSVTEPPAPVRIDGATGEITRLPATFSPAPGQPVTVPSSLTEVTATADDGAALRAWLVLPPDASQAGPAPLLLWIHGGPFASWNDWQWRWNPNLAAARGYAVLLPDPCLSTGYGPEMIERGWGDWGSRTQADLMALTDACAARPDVDGSRIAAMGGSFGGYMANWIAGHTGRFKAIVTHASLWNLEQFGGTTDLPIYWQRQFGRLGGEPYTRNSPHLRAAEIRTPMLVIHGDKDYRVPIGEALRLWWDLTQHEVDAKFLYFPDENHWILKPGNIVVWYETVFAFLAHHVLGEAWRRPDLL